MVICFQQRFFFASFIKRLTTCPLVTNEVASCGTFILNTFYYFLSLTLFSRAIQSRGSSGGGFLDYHMALVTIYMESLEFFL
jgi:hypothetical protein